MGKLLGGMVVVTQPTNHLDNNTVVRSCLARNLIKTNQNSQVIFSHIENKEWNDRREGGKKHKTKPVNEKKV